MINVSKVFIFIGVFLSSGSIIWSIGIRNVLPYYIPQLANPGLQNRKNLKAIKSDRGRGPRLYGLPYNDWSLNHVGLTHNYPVKMTKNDVKHTPSLYVWWPSTFDNIFIDSKERYSCSCYANSTKDYVQVL